MDSEKYVPPNWVKYKIDSWRPRALAYAKSLKGRERTETEKKFAREHPDPWDYFYVFGSQEDTQVHIDKTIRLIEECDHLGKMVICELRLKWSTEELKK